MWRQIPHMIADPLPPPWSRQCVQRFLSCLMLWSFLPVLIVDLHVLRLDSLGNGLIVIDLQSKWILDDFGLLFADLHLWIPLQFGVVYSFGVEILFGGVVLTIVWLNQMNKGIGELGSPSIWWNSVVHIIGVCVNSLTLILKWREKHQDFYQKHPILNILCSLSLGIISIDRSLIHYDIPILCMFMPPCSLQFALMHSTSWFGNLKFWI